MFYQYLISNHRHGGASHRHGGANNMEIIKCFAAMFVILALVLGPLYPLQVVAEDVPPEETPVEASAVVETGDALAETETVSDVNVNVVNTQPSPASSAEATDGQGASAGEAETVPVEESQPSLEENTENSPSLDVSLDNTAVVENESETAAETGDNTTSSEEGDALITTGDAYASANVVSVVNFNLVESNGFLFLLNNFLQSLGHIDLRLFAPSSISNPAPSNPCGVPDCDATATSLSVQAENEANISNVIIVRSSTGSNLATGNGASINTGNAYAGANVVNIANTNIINSNYLLFAFNSFGGWDGDLIFPNSNFFSNFFLPFSMNGVDVSSTNLANVTSEVETSANTGINETEGGSIETGDAVALSNVTNIVNTNLVNAPTFYVIFRIFGAWNGSVFNTPEGISWNETSSGLELFSSDEIGDSLSTGSGSSSGGGINVETNNIANIGNNVKVFALTGENRVTGTGENASINTGNAYAGANVLNIANTNIVSSNWIIALINIFGDWNGNFSFGQPDIWVATEVEAADTLTPGSEPIFHTTVANRGDARASNIKFNGKFDSPFINFKDKNSGEEYSWDVGALNPGELREFSYTAQVAGGLPFGQTLIDHTFEVSALETDANTEDNSDKVSLLAYRSAPYSGRVSHAQFTRSSTYPDLHITKTYSATTTAITASSTVDYTIVVENDGGSAFEGVLYDVLKDEDGKIIADNDWELGEIFPNEEITITYTAFFNASTTPGIYTNSAWVEAWGGNYSQDVALATDASSKIASSSITVVGDGENESEVLGISCGLYMDKFIRTGAANDVEQVKKLQKFLNKEMDTNLPISGFYGPLTFNVTKAFQEKYTNDILALWDGLEEPTGIVYETTIRWINKIECPPLALSTPSLIDWSRNPNTPSLLAISQNRTRQNKDVVTYDIPSKSLNRENKKNLLASSMEGFLDFIKSMFKQEPILQFQTVEAEE